MVIKPKRTSWEWSRYFHFDENMHIVSWSRNIKWMRDSKRSCKSFKSRFAMSKHSKHKRRLKSIRRRDPLKEDLPKKEYAMWRID